MNTYICFDLETTGLSTSSSIIEIGAWKVVDGVVVDKFDTLVNPPTFVPEHITQITGITKAMLRDAPNLEDVLPDFILFCEDLPFIGHNFNQFDYPLLREKAHNLGLDITNNKTRLGIDTLPLARKYLQSERNTVKALIEYYSIVLPEGIIAHRALNDAYMTRMIYERMVINFPHNPEINFPTLLDVKNINSGKAGNQDELPLY